MSNSRHNVGTYEVLLIFSILYIKGGKQEITHNTIDNLIEELRKASMIECLLFLMPASHTKFYKAQFSLPRYGLEANLYIAAL